MDERRAHLRSAQAVWFRTIRANKPDSFVGPAGVFPARTGSLFQNRQAVNRDERSTGDVDLRTSTNERPLRGIDDSGQAAAAG